MNAKIRYFLAGFGSIFSILPAAPTFGQPPATSDRAALAGDWQRVGRDIRGEMQRVDGEQKESESASPD